MKTFLKLRLLFVYERFASRGKTENFLTLTSEIKILKGNAFVMYNKIVILMQGRLKSGTLETKIVY